MPAAQITAHALRMARIGIDKQNLPAIGRDRIHRPHRVFDGDLPAGLRPCPQFIGKRFEPHQALDARHQLHVVDRLGEKIIGADFKPANTVRPPSHPSRV